MAENDTELRMVFIMDEALDLLTATGYRKAAAQLTLDERHNVVDALLDYHLMGKVKAEMDQFIDGLGCIGLLEALRENPASFAAFFLYTDVKLTPGMFR